MAHEVVEQLLLQAFPCEGWAAVEVCVAASTPDAIAVHWRRVVAWGVFREKVRNFNNDGIELEPFEETVVRGLGPEGQFIGDISMTSNFLGYDRIDALQAAGINECVLSGKTGEWWRTAAADLVREKPLLQELIADVDAMGGAGGEDEDAGEADAER